MLKDSLYNFYCGFSGWDKSVSVSTFVTMGMKINYEWAPQSGKSHYNYSKPVCDSTKKKKHHQVLCHKLEPTTQTSNCCRRLKASPLCMSFSRASFSLRLRSLCTSSWAALSSLSNLHKHTHVHTLH